MNAAGQSGLAPRTEVEPAATITGKGTAAWVYRSTPMDNSAQRDLDAPAPTIMRGHETPQWVRFGNQDHSAVRSVDEPAATLRYSERANACDWIYDRPATTVQGDPRIAEPGHRDREGGVSQFDGESVRVTVTEAAILQSFRPDYPWQGSKTKQFEQVGNAIPPLLAAAILGHLLNVDGWQDVCRGWFASESVA